LSVVSWSIVPDSKSVLTFTNVLSPVEWTFTFHYALDLEEFAILDGVSIVLNSFSVKVPSISGVIVAVPECNMIVIMEFVTAECDAFLSIVSQVSS